MQEPRPMNINGINTNTFVPQKLFNITSVDDRNVELSVKRLIVPTIINYQTDYQTEESSIFLRIIGGNLDFIDSIADKKFSAEMERITKKKPPKKTTVQMIFPEFDNDYNDISPVFKDLLPEQGKIYVGFPTHQTTGCCSHIEARVIPTVCTVL